MIQRVETRIAHHSQRRGADSAPGAGAAPCVAAAARARSPARRRSSHTRTSAATGRVRGKRVAPPLPWRPASPPDAQLEDRIRPVAPREVAGDRRRARVGNRRGAPGHVCLVVAVSGGNECSA